jgi:hypothetical protein
MLIRARLALAAMLLLIVIGSLAPPTATALPATGVATRAVTAPTGDAADRTMTRAQARRAYLDAVCPANEAIIAIARVWGAPGVDWATLQPLARTVAETQFRGARVMSDPPGPWPVDVGSLIPPVTAQYLTFGGMYSVLSSATSMEMFNTLSESASVSDPVAAIKRIQAANRASVRLIRARLGLPPKGGSDPR